MTLPRLLLLVLLVTPATAYAAPRPADTKAIETCLTSAEGSFGAKCIGIVADPCINDVKDDNATSSKARACAARELAVWEAFMATALKAVGASPYSKQVASAQAAWRTSRDALCPVFDKMDPGTMDNADYCRLQDTAQRTLLVRRLAVSAGEH